MDAPAHGAVFGPVHGPLAQAGVPSIVIAAIALYSWFCPPSVDKDGRDVFSHHGKVVVSTTQNAPPTTTTDGWMYDEQSSSMMNAVFNIISSSHDFSTLVSATSHGTPSSPPPAATSTSTTFFGTPVSAPVLTTHLPMLERHMENHLSSVISWVTILCHIFFGQGVLGWISFVIFVLQWMPDRCRPKPLRRRRHVLRNHNTAGHDSSRSTCHKCSQAWKALQAAKADVKMLDSEVTDLKAAAASTDNVSRFSFAAILALLRSRKLAFDNTQSLHRRTIAKLEADATREADLLKEKVANLEAKADRDADLYYVEIEKAERETARLRSSLESTENMLSENRSSLASRQQQLDKLQSHHAKMLADHEQQMEAATDVADAETTRLKTELRAIRMKADHADERLSVQTEDLLQLKREVDSDRTSHREVVATWQRKFQVQRDLRKSVESKANEELATLRTVIEDTREDLAKQREVVLETQQASKRRQESHDEQIAALKGEVTKATKLREEESKSAERVIEELNDQITEAEAELDEHRERLVNDTSEEVIALLNERINSLESASKDAAKFYEEESQTAEREKDALRSRLQHAEDIISGQDRTLSSSAPEARPKMVSADTQTTQSTVDTEAQTDDRAAKREAVTAKVIAHLRAELLTAGAEIAQLRADADRAAHEVQKRETGMQSLGTQTESLEQSTPMYTEALPPKLAVQIIGTLAETHPEEPQVQPGVITHITEEDLALRARMEQTVTGLQGELATSRGETAQLHGHLELIMQEGRSVTEKLNRAEQERSEALAHAEFVKSQAAELKHAHDKVQQELQSQMRRFAEAGDKERRNMESYEQRLKNEQAVGAANKRQAVDLERKLAQYKDIERKHTKYNDMERKLIESEMIASTLQQDLQNSEAEKAKHTRHNRDLLDKLVKLQRRADSGDMMTTQCERERAKNEKLQIEIQLLQAERSVLQANQDSLETVVKSQRRQLRTYTGENLRAAMPPPTQGEPVVTAPPRPTSAQGSNGLPADFQEYTDQALDAVLNDTWDQTEAADRAQEAAIAGRVKAIPKPRFHPGHASTSTASVPLPPTTMDLSPAQAPAGNDTPQTSQPPQSSGSLKGKEKATEVPESQLSSPLPSVPEEMEEV